MKEKWKWFDRNFEPIIITTFFFAMTILIIVQVILRFVFQSGFSWGEEVAKFIYVWICFIGIAYATKCNKQISVNYLRNALSPMVQKGILIFTDLATLLLASILLKAAIDSVKAIAEFGDKALSLPISMNVMYAAAVFGYSLLIFRVVQNLVWKTKRIKNSLTLFENENYLYSGRTDICFMPKKYKEELLESLDKAALNEEGLSRGKE